MKNSQRNINADLTAQQSWHRGFQRHKWSSRYLISMLMSTYHSIVFAASIGNCIKKHLAWLVRLLVASHVSVLSSELWQEVCPQPDRFLTPLASDRFSARSFSNCNTPVSHSHSVTVLSYPGSSLTNYLHQPLARPTVNQDPGLRQTLNTDSVRPNPRLMCPAIVAWHFYWPYKYAASV